MAIEFNPVELKLLLTCLHDKIMCNNYSRSKNEFETMGNMMVNISKELKNKVAENEGNRNS